MTNKVLIVDLRTPFHCQEFQRVVSKVLKQRLFDKIVYLMPASLSMPVSLSMPEQCAETIRYECSPSSYKSLWKILLLVHKIKSNMSVSTEYSFLTPVNSGPLYDVLANKLLPKEVFLFEDGISSYLEICVRYRLAKKILFSIICFRFAVIAKKKFFADKTLKNVTVYSDKPALVNVINPYVNVVELEDIKLNFNKSDDQICFYLSSSSVEYGLQSISDYRSCITKASVSLTDLPVRVSFHHNESRSDEKVAILSDYLNVVSIVPPDVAVESEILSSQGNITLVAPFNSTALSMCFKRKDVSLILYDDKGPNIELRKKLFVKIQKNTKQKITII